MISLSRSLALAALLALPVFAQDFDGKIRGDLQSVLDAAAPAELVPVTVVLRESANAAELRALGAGLPKAERRAIVIAHLKAVAATTQGDLLSLLELRATAGEAEDVRALWIHNVVCAEVTPALALELAARADVSYVHREVRSPVAEILTTLPAAPGALGGNPTCGVQLIRAPEVWAQYGINGDGVVVGVIDSGVCLGHPDIGSRLWTNPLEVPGNGVDDDGNGFIDDVRGWNFDQDNNWVGDTSGHGSHVAGTVVGDGTGGTACGVAPGARVMVLKPNLTFTGEQTVWDCMQYGLDNGADILTASLGWPHDQSPDRATWRAVCENAIATGTTVVFSAGNEGGFNAPDNVRTPGDVPDVLTVGAVDCSDGPNSFSSRGPVTWQDVAPYNDHPWPPGYTKPDVVAEGVDTTSHSGCSGYVNFQGTSMSTPHVAGAAALLLQADPTLDHYAVKSILEGTAVHLGVNQGKNNRYGWGRIDAFVAVGQALTGGNFCAGKLNSCGTIPLVWTDGDASASATAGFEVTALNMAGNSLALLVYTDQGSANVPILGGSLCISSFLRSGPLFTGGTQGLCDGVATIDMNAFAAGALGGFPAGFLSVPGTTVHAQFWARDTQNSFGALLTGAVSYTVAP